MSSFGRIISLSVKIGLFAAIACSYVFLVSSHHIIWANSSIGEDTIDIKFSNGQLSATLKNSPLEKVLKEIMSQSGARIWLNDSIDGTVTAEFQNLPVKEAIQKILRDKNYAFVYSVHDGKEGKLSIVNVSKTNERFANEKASSALKPPTKPVPPIVKKDKPKKDTISFETLAKDALEHEDSGKREDAIIALGESKDPRAIEIISKALANDPSEDVRLSAIDALVDIGDKNIIDPLSSALNDRDPWVRESAVEALGEIGGEAAIEYIKNALNDEDGSVRELAQEILEELNTKK
ncbi:PBS lyase HEAT-like repeat protein [Candidatus Brocadiaceae bacterium B188]|nr:HEAT repeat domain-containing protein [Candidatus Brocadia sapporoensis]QQR66102.1 MAG: HEAT repeat domain-containing protein [Candidatus Brocadia sp.]RZV57710.1 MAG: HEAT repeat domain-containing protein [Candidatus Brocadia sp. BROELEC01]TWU53021.1 PBS lyase HEAT-like repeat protein [Candidatus Brocadiaceae bacterium B188]